MLHLDMLPTDDIGEARPIIESDGSGASANNDRNPVRELER
jgi:hypothetical protein